MSNKPSAPRSRSLEGYQIALTAPHDDPASPAEALSASGARVLFYPVSQELPPDSQAPLDAALARCQSGSATWLLLPTPCAADAVAARMHELEITPADMQEVSLAVFGAKTRLTVATLLPEWSVSITESATHEQLINAMQLTPDDAVVIPIAQRSRADWPELIASHGASADIVAAYRLLLGRGGDDVPGLLWEGNVDALFFLTENSVRHFAIRLKAEGGTLDMLNDVVVVCLDEATATAARTYGLNVQITVPSDAVGAPAEVLAHQLRPEVTPR